MSSHTCSKQALLGVLQKYVSSVLAYDLLERRLSRLGIDLQRLQTGDSSRLLRELTAGVRLFVSDAVRREDCCGQLEKILAQSASAAQKATPSDLEMGVQQESDIVAARVAARTLCEELAFASFDQIKIATVVSELARNILRYAKQGLIKLRVLPGERMGLEIVAVDDGPGIPNLDEIFSGKYKSRTGMGKGLCFVRNSMSEFEIETGPGKGTRITGRKYRDGAS